ncbi:MULTISPECIES: hypothetical protein [Streptomyces]|uniref:Uncharacterized protein n=1 Tax=Streptomyces achmelvichensis TaxID=3134111 RepID=A0ACC6PWA5_9ACTN|nr:MULTISPECIES: hypothetical protein [unclassified Streptomyces]WNO73873.1 hypothetical protein RPQ07_20590 [Streptomyces sp. AM8-1-1]WST38627.1 hypothetical protein OG317_16910 [Streptomyces sp. NBC_01167]
MSTATFTPAAHVPPPHHGATATGAPHSPHRVGNALRAVKVFAEAVFSVAVLGEYAEEAGVRRR